ncbi:MAG: T9SS type A sorting domain-containing protein [Bacteroidota bacterium]
MRTNLSLTSILVIMVAFTTTSLYAQRSCGAMDHLEMQMERDAKRAIKMDRIEQHTQEVIHSRSAVNGTITIPVVFHVVYNGSAENLSDAQLQSQLDVMNEDFRRLNADAANTPSTFLGVAADVEIEFCLATIDPAGNPTNGITRTSTTRTSFGTNDAVKFASSGGKDAWPSSDYLNFWVCDIGGGILGYAQFPGGPANTDGVVNDYRYTGRFGSAQAPFNLGRTATHEVGHWLNLRHIWGDGNCNADDFVGDTPTAGGPNYTGSPCSFPGSNSCNDGAGDQPDMFQNYMDYSDDGCMNLYTAGQKARMRALFEPGGFRESLLSSPACGTPATPTCTDGIQNGNETGVDCGGPDCPACPPQTCTDVVITINFDNYPEETTWTITNAGGATVASGGPYGSQPDGSTLTITECLDDGCYDFRINDSYGDGICCAYGNGSYNVSVNGSSVASGGNFGSSETTNFCIGGGPAPTCDDGVQNGSETGIDCGGPDCPACPVTCNTPAGLDAAPTDISASLSWNAAAGANDYNIRARQVGTAAWTSGANLGSPVNYTGLTACTDYEFQVQSNCTGATSAWSSSFVFTTTGCTGGGCTTQQIDFENFDSGWGIWNDGGSDSRRLSNTTYANSPTYSIRLRDNTSSSVMTTDNLNLSGYEEVTVDFTYIANSMENGEDFWLQVSTNGGSSYTTVETWVRNIDFVNNSREFESVTITGTFTSNTRLRFRCDASANADQVYIDDVNISGCFNATRQTDELVRLADEAADMPSIDELTLFPNPTQDQLNVNFNFNRELEAKVNVYVTDMTGKLVQQQQWNTAAGVQRQQLDVSQLPSGTYLIHILSGEERVTQRFVVAH